MYKLWEEEQFKLVCSPSLGRATETDRDIQAATSQNKGRGGGRGGKRQAEIYSQKGQAMAMAEEEAKPLKTKCTCSLLVSLGPQHPPKVDGPRRKLKTKESCKYEC